MATAGSSTTAQISPSSKSHHERFTIITRGISFHLSRSQIEYDSPNYFTSAFLEHNFQEAREKILYTDRNPQLFALIVEHLSGYKIVPLTERVIPQTMSLETAHANLLADADYFQLDKLGAELRNLPPAPKHDHSTSSQGHTLPPTPSNLYNYLHWRGLEDPVLSTICSQLKAAGLPTPQAIRRHGSYGVRVRIGCEATTAEMIVCSDQEWPEWLAQAPKY